MKKVGLIALLAALICGFAIYLYLGSVEDRITEATEEHALKMEEIVVANGLIPPYTEITEEMLRLEQYPADYVNKQAVRSFDEVVGLQSDGTLVDGQILMTTMFGTAEDVGASLSYKVPDGMRAMTLSVEVDSGVAGYMTRGDLVDVLLYLPLESENPATLHSRSGKSGETPQSITRVVQQGAMVLELGDVTYSSETSGVYTNITLALEPEECLTLLSAVKQAEKNGGAIYTTLRQRGDGSETDTGSYAVDELLN